MRKQRNKYLDNLAIPIEKYGTNFTKRIDSRNKKWKRQQAAYGFDERETWGMDIIFFEWLYSHCMMFKEYEDQKVLVDTIEYDGGKYTVLDAINCIIEKTGNYLKIYHTSDTFDYEKEYKEMQHITHLWAELLPHMWW